MGRKGKENEKKLDETGKKGKKWENKGKKWEEMERNVKYEK